MIPPRVSTSTSATAGAFPLFHRTGAMRLVVIIKQRFSVSPEGAERIPGATIQLADVPWSDDSPRSSIRYPSDLCLEKPGTDVVVVGQAIPHGGVPVTSLDVSVRVGALHKELRVFGLRVWAGGIGSLVPSPPRPFDEQPIRWEDAWGGPDGEPRNPHGRGLAAKPETLLHTPMPHVEDPANLIRDHRSRPPPAGFSALSPAHPNRLRFAGTMDQRWQDEWAPLPPRDSDPRQARVAVPELQSPSHLTGGEPVSFSGMHPSGPVSFPLPRLHFGVRAWTGRTSLDARPVLDTVLLAATDLEAELTWRTSFPSEQVRSVEVYEKEAVS